MPSFTRNINLISRCGSAYRGDGLEGSGLSSAHYFYLLAICNHPDVSQDQLAKFLYLNKSSVTRAIATLERDGFVERVPHAEDKRVLLLRPTERALALLPRVREVARGWNDFLLSDLSDEERETFLATLEKISQKARSYIDGRPREDEQ